MSYVAKRAEFDTPEWRKVRDRKLAEWLLGDADAVEFVRRLSAVFELWDDLIDGDRQRSGEEINAGFMNALIYLPNNPFYARHRGYFEPLIIAAINAWHDSNLLVERQDRDARMHAHFLRELDNELFVATTFVVGGFAHMRQVSLEMRDFLKHETYPQWEHAL